MRTMADTLALPVAAAVPPLRAEYAADGRSAYGHHPLTAAGGTSDGSAIGAPFAATASGDGAPESGRAAAGDGLPAAARSSAATASAPSSSFPAADRPATAAPVSATDMPTPTVPADRTTAEQPDSLAAPRTDSLAACACDAPAADTPAPFGALFRPLAPEELFGPQSTTADDRLLPPHETHPLTADPLYQLFLLMLVALYIRFVYRHIDDVRQLLARITADGRTREQQAFDDRNNAGFSRFLYAAWALGTLFAGAVALRFAEGGPAAPFGPRMALPLSLAVSLGFAALSLLQFGALLSTGALTLTQPFVERLVHLRRTHFAAAFLGLIPVFSLYVLAPEPLRHIPLYMAGSVSVIMLLLFLKESLTLFVSKKIPILHWILYLCAVECLPVSFIALMLARR